MRWRRACAWGSIIVFLLVPVASWASLTDAPTDWSNFSSPDAYTAAGSPVTDHESSSDPSNGGTGVQPAAVDIASCSADGSNPGNEPSVWWDYYDGGTPYNPSDPTTMEDDFVFFRLRLDDDPTESGQQKGFTSYTWDVLIDIDGDGYKEFVVQADGTEASSKPDVLRVSYNDNATNTIDPTTDTIDEFMAAGPGADPGDLALSHTRVVPAPCAYDSGEYFLDFQVPLVAFKNGSGTQLVFPNTPLRLFYSTASSNTNPLQKDLMMSPGDGINISTDPIAFGDEITYESGPTAVGLTRFTAFAMSRSSLIGGFALVGLILGLVSVVAWRRRTS